MNTTEQFKIKIEFKDGIHSIPAHHMRVIDNNKQYICFDFDEFIKMVINHGDCFDYQTS